MVFPTHIFKAYDIRGLVDTELSPELAYAIAGAFGSFLRTKKLIEPGQKVVVGYDMRPTSLPFSREVTRGLTEQGIDVVEIGLVSTPLFNFTCAHYPEHAGGIMITASHNPAEYNGFKLTLGNGLPIGKNTGMDEIRDLAQAGHFTVVENNGVVTQKDPYPDYLATLRSLVDFSTIKPLKIVVDAGNGMAKVSLPRILQELPVEVEYLYLEPDGNFPHHEANPLKIETLHDLQRTVQEKKSDFGFALDGDADRIGLVDDTGAVIDASFVGALVGLEVLKKYPGAHMLYDLRSSKIVPEVWESHGATTEKCMVGHALIKKIMHDQGALFASELSLHLYFGELHNLECSDLALLYILQVVSREQKPLSQIIKPYKKYTHSGEINFAIHDKAAALSRIKDTYAEEAEETLEIDGLWYNFSWGWVSIRTSNTEPVIRLNLETANSDLTKEKVAEFSKILQEFV